MKKSDLKTGVHSVVFRNGKIGKIVGECIRGANGVWAILANFDEDLKHENNKDFDVVEILERTSIWQREEKEMIEIDGVEYEKDFVLNAIKDATFPDFSQPKEEPKEEKKKLVELVKELQGELGGSYSIYQNDVGNYRCRTGWADIGAVTMLELTADKICEMLNNEEYKLDV